MTADRVRPTPPNQLVPVGTLVRDHTPRVVASSRTRTDPRAATDEDVLLRLALWLADVAAETSVGKAAS